MEMAMAMWMAISHHPRMSPRATPRLSATARTSALTRTRTWRSGVSLARWERAPAGAWRPAVGPTRVGRARHLFQMETGETGRRLTPSRTELGMNAPAANGAARCSLSGSTSTSDGDCGESTGGSSRFHDFSCGIPYALFTVCAGVAAHAFQLYGVSWISSKHRWMSIIWQLLGMPWLWIDGALGVFILVVNILALRAWRRRDNAGDPRFRWSPYTIASYLAANVLSSRSAMRLHLHMLISPKTAIPLLGKVWLLSGIVVHNLMSWAFLYNIKAGGNPSSK